MSKIKKTSDEILAETEGFRADIVMITQTLRAVATKISAWEWHNDISFELCCEKILAAQEAIEELTGHTAMVMTNAPTHDRYRIDAPPKHIAIKHTDPKDWDLN